MGRNKNDKKEELITVIYLVLWMVFILAVIYAFQAIFNK